MKRLIHSALMTATALALLGTLPSVAQQTTAQETTVHVSQAEAVKAAKERPAPEYPPMARQLHLEGAVQVEARIAENGVVEEVKPLTGNAVLMSAAVAAMKKWKFTPFVSDGKPTKAVADMSFTFKM